MNKKILFAAMSLAVLASCSTDDFQSQANLAEESGSVQFEVVNNNDAFTRASMGGTNGTKVIFSAADGDLFTLYHGGADATGYQNATYTASGSPAVLSTPSMIKTGTALMVWPVDTTFTNNGTAGIAINIPADQKKDIENYIPHVSDVITINGRTPAGKYNEAGYKRPYPVYMRPMGSQLTIKADYVGSETIEALYNGGANAPAEGGIDEIEVISMELLTNATGSTKFTTKIPLTFTSITPGDANDLRWNTTAETKVANNNWTAVTGFAAAAATSVDKLATKCLIANNGGAKFVVLPQAAMAPGVGVDAGAVVVRTNYGKVIIAQGGDQGSQYTPAEDADAWYRVKNTAAEATADATTDENAVTTAETAGPATGKFKITAQVKFGLQQFFNAIRTNTHAASTTSPSPVETEPEGAAGTRYVKVLLKYLDMSDLHIDNDKWLRDAAYVWQAMGALNNVVVYLDGDDNKEFEISQQTIAAINAINTAVAAGTGNTFKVKPCNVAGEVCDRIVITGGGNIPDLSFIEYNDINEDGIFDFTDTDSDGIFDISKGDVADGTGGTDKVADVVLKAGESWSWSKKTVAKKKAIIVDATAPGVASIINEGTFTSDADATLAIYNNASPSTQVTTIPFENDGTWSIAAGKTINVQLDVTNYGTLTIPATAEYRQDGAGNDFTNEATDLPSRFGGDDDAIGLVDNSGVFANINGGHINNYGLIEHRIAAAKTFITKNENGGTGFTASFNDPANKIGRINLTWDNRAEDNVTVNNAAATGFVSVTVDGEVSTLGTTAGALGAYVNYIIIKSGVTEINALNAQYKYVEIADKNNTEIAWKTGTASAYTGLIVLSPVNITMGTSVTSAVTYLGANMYVGGTFNKTGLGATNWNGYYGNTAANVATKYITFN